MEQLKIYGAYAEGFMCHGTVEINPQKPWLCVYEIAEAYASVGIDIDGAKPVVLDFDDEGFAPGFEVDGVTYVHFKVGHVPNGVLIREA